MGLALAAVAFAASDLLRALRRPLVSHEIDVNLIANTTTTTGLRVRAKIDTRTYETGKEVPKEVLNALNIQRDAFHGDWSYTLHPRT